MPVQNTLKEFLEAKQMSRYEFAKVTGVSQTTVYFLYDNPDSLPQSSVLNKICDYFRIQPNEIIIWIAPAHKKSPAKKVVYE